MDKVTLWLGIAVSVQTLLSVATTILISWMHARFKLEMLDLMKTELRSYVGAQQFKDYVDGHAREHLVINSEITRLRDFRHDAGDEIRSLGSSVENLKDKEKRDDRDG